MSNKNYRLVEGLPDKVEREVNKLIDEGWMFHGTTMLRTTSDDVQVVIQPMKRNPEPTAIKC